MNTLFGAPFGSASACPCDGTCGRITVGNRMAQRTETNLMSTVCQEKKV